MSETRREFAGRRRQGGRERNPRPGSDRSTHAGGLRGVPHRRRADAGGRSGRRPLEDAPARTMRVRIKVCGITTARDAEICVEAGADALGFVFSEASPRFVDPKRAAGIARELPPYLARVGVFVSPRAADLES